MLFKGLIILVVVQIFLFFTGFVFNKKISERSRVLGKALKSLYIFDSFVMIVYLLIGIIYILSQETGYFESNFTKTIYSLCFIVIILSNAWKLILFFKNELFYNSPKVQIRDLLDYLGLCGIVVSLILSIILKVNYLPDNKQLIETIQFNNVEVRKVDLNQINSQGEIYQLILKDKFDEEYIFKLEQFRSATYFYTKDKYIKRYEIKEIEENGLGMKNVNIYYDYVIAIQNDTEKFLISSYLHKGK